MADARMQVVQLLTRLNVGGPARHVLTVARLLADRCDITVHAGRPTDHEGTLSDPAVDVHDVPLVRAVDPRRDAAALRAVRRMLACERPDILHTHMAKAGAVGRSAARSLPQRPRTVHTFHGHVLAGYFPPAVEQRFVRAERLLARATDRIVAVSPEIRDELLDLGIGRPSQYEVIPLGFDLAPFLAVNGRSGALRARLELDDATPLVGVPARLTAIKGHDVLLRAMVDVPGAHAVLLGDGEMRRDLHAAAGRFGVADRIHFAGWWNDMPSALADLDVVALTSYNEGTPVALIEAAAAGLPVVASQVGGTAAVVVDGTTGFLTPPGATHEVARRLVTLVVDTDLRERLGQAARRHARSRFGAQAMTEALAQLYVSLAAPRPRR